MHQLMIMDGMVLTNANFLMAGQSFTIITANNIQQSLKIF